MSGNLRFGVLAPEDMIAKAKRELERLGSASEQESKDHAMNAALTISHLTDWIFHAGRCRGVTLGNFPQFAKAARDANSGVAAITDIANASKHFEITRRNSSATAVGPGDIVFVRDFMFTSYMPPFVPRGGSVKAVRTLIEDDEIVGFETIATGHRIDAPTGPRLFVDACFDALNFWEVALTDLKAGNVPNWL